MWNRASACLVLLALVGLAAPANARTITFDEFFYVPGSDLPSAKSSVNAWYGPEVTFSALARHNVDEVSLLWLQGGSNGSVVYDTYVLAPGYVRGEIGGFLYVNFAIPVMSVELAVSYSGGPQPGVGIIAFDEDGGVVGQGYNDASDVPYVFDFSLTNPARNIASIVLSSDPTFGYGLDTLVYVVPEPHTSLLVMAGLVGLGYGRRRFGRAAHGARLS